MVKILLLILTVTIATVLGAPNWWTNGGTGGTFYPGNGGSGGSFYPGNGGSGGSFYPSGNGGSGGAFYPGSNGGTGGSFYPGGKCFTSKTLRHNYHVAI